MSRGYPNVKVFASLPTLLKTDSRSEITKSVYIITFDAAVTILIHLLTSVENIQSLSLLFTQKKHRVTLVTTR